MEEKSIKITITDGEADFDLEFENCSINNETKENILKSISEYLDEIFKEGE